LGAYWGRAVAGPLGQLLAGFRATRVRSIQKPPEIYPYLNQPRLTADWSSQTRLKITESLLPIEQLPSSQNTHILSTDLDFLNTWTQLPAITTELRPWKRLKSNYITTEPIYPH